MSIGLHFRPTTVYWEDDPGRTRVVQRACKVCRRFLLREYGVFLSATNVSIVSPSGLAHCQHDSNEGHTACGKDATGPDWWWPT